MLMIRHTNRRLQGVVVKEEPVDSSERTNPVFVRTVTLPNGAIQILDSDDSEQEDEIVIRS